MTIFSKNIFIGPWIVLLMITAGNVHGPAFSFESNQELFSEPSTTRFLRLHSPQLHSSTFTTTPEQVSITKLLSHGAAYHQRLIAIRGVVTQPELHLDESELVIRFVFRLAEGDQSIVVFGQHDRTQGAPSISLDLSVEVIGIFWKERELNASHVFNTIEALTVLPYPSLVPDNA